MKVSQLETNNGQLGWLPKNPRQWTQTDIDRTKASIQEDTDFLEDRPLLVCPGLSGKYVVFGGNLRLTAARSLKLKEVPVVVYCLDEGGPEQDEIRETIKRRAMKDNGSFGAWDYDALANEWDDLPLQDWGVPAWKEEEDVDLSPKEKTQTELLSGIEYNGVYYEPDEVPQLELRDCINTDKFDAKIAALDEYDLTPEQKETLRLFAYRFLRIDFEAVANYYAFNATDEERKAIERLRLVLSDNGLNGFIEDKLLRVAKIAEDAAREE